MSFRLRQQAGDLVGRERHRGGLHQGEVLLHARAVVLGLSGVRRARSIVVKHQHTGQHQTITATVGLFSWAGSLLSVLSLPEALSNALVLGAAWNAPAYVVALGMILTILEEQIREAAEAGRQLAHQAYHDALTGLPNRLLFDDRLSQALARARRHNTRAAVMCIDLDRLKQVNDTFGHHVGDLYLKEVVGRLNSRIRGSDTLARTGGDEFSVVVADFPVPPLRVKLLKPCWILCMSR